MPTDGRVQLTVHDLPPANEARISFPCWKPTGAALICHAYDARPPVFDMTASRDPVPNCPGVAFCGSRNAQGLGVPFHGKAYG
jgi:hypothetical protein